MADMDLSGLMGSYLGDLRVTQSSRNRFFALHRIWEDIGDANTHEFTRGIYLIEDADPPTLKVYVESPQWAQEFTMNKVFYLAKLKRRYPEAPFSDLVFVVNKDVKRKKAAEKKEAEPHYREMGDISVTLDEKERQEIVGMVSDIRSDDVREAARKATEAYLSWKKRLEPSK